MEPQNQDDSDYALETALAKSVWNSAGATIQDLSHIKGAGRWIDEDKWNQLGRNCREVFDRFGSDLHRDGRRHHLKILEWGPGGGGIARQFIDLAIEYHGVDISQYSLKQFVEAIDGHGVEVVQWELSGDPGFLELPTHSFDLFLSTAVFQHFPSKSYGLRVLDKVQSSLRRGGLGIVQIRYDDGSEKFAPKALETYADSFVRQTSYRLEEFWSATVERGMKPVAITNINASVNYAFFVFRA